MTLKVCNTAMQCCHRTALGMACAAVANGFFLETFLAVKRRLEKSALSRVASPAEAEAALMGCWKMKNWRYWRRKKWWTVSAPPLQYYPGLRRKKKAIHAMFLMVFCLCVPTWWEASRAWRTETGIGQTCVGGRVALGICDEFPAQPKV